MSLLNWRWRVAALLNGFKDATAYRWEFLIEILSSALVPALVQIVLWYALFRSPDIQGQMPTEIGGMSYEALLSYTLMSVLFTQVRGGDHDFELQEMIRSGQLSNYLLRPIGVVEFTYIRGVAPKLLIAVVALIVGSAAGLYFGYSPLRMAGAMVLALVGNVIHYQIGAVLATVAFVWEEAFSILMVKNMVVSFLSGELIPLNLFPISAQWIWKSTPFYLYVFGPTQYALGHTTHTEFLNQLGIGVMWMLVSWLMIRISWGLGMRRYLSLGG